MQTRPPDLSDSAVAAAASERWGLPPLTAAYRPVGYGSHHWSLEAAAGARWFASVDVLDGQDPDESFGRLSAAFETAAAARDSGLSFVVAPLRTCGGDVLTRLGGYALAVYPHVEGRFGGFGDSLAAAEAGELVAMLRRLHEVEVERPGDDIRMETFEIAGRVRLEATFGEAAVAEGWPGPYGEALRRLLDRHRDDVDRVLREHDRLVATAGPQTERLVLTHGEPHPGNLVRGKDGLMLIDWDTALLAPPERDLWLVDARADGRASAEYAALTGRPVVPELLERYRLAWSLADLVVYVELLRHTPAETADTTWSWEALKGTLEEMSTVG